MISVHPFRNGGQPELTVMTWNVHCPEGTDSMQQRRIAELILEVDADFVQLNEYNQDSCFVTDSILKTWYPYTEEYQSHHKCGNIFYSKLKMCAPRSIRGMKRSKVIHTIKAIIEVGNDSVHIIGVHMASNRFKGLGGEYENDTSSFDRYKKSQKLRCFHAHRAKEAVLESKHPVIVMGDMNDFNCSAPLDTLTSCGLKDAWWEGGFGYGATFHNGWMRLRIDHILHSKELILERVKVIDTDLSDHNPVVAGFSISK